MLEGLARINNNWSFALEEEGAFEVSTANCYVLKTEMSGDYCFKKKEEV